MKYKWRGVTNQKSWWHHPRAFWTTETSAWVRKLSLRQRWYLAFHDPIYMSLWAALIVILGLTAWGVL